MDPTATLTAVYLTAVASNYVAQSGEVVFPDVATPAALTAAFAGYAAAAAAAAATLAGIEALAAGVPIQSTSTSSLNATYSCDGGSQANINATVTYILLNGTFPGGGSTMPWADVTGAIHVFPNVAVFKGFATATANYVAAAELYADSGGVDGSLLGTPVVIA